jgi:hypothetical protein
MCLRSGLLRDNGLNSRKSLKIEKVCPKIWMALKEFGLIFQNMSPINVHKI